MLSSTLRHTQKAVVNRTICSSSVPYFTVRADCDYYGAGEMGGVPKMMFYCPGGMKVSEAAKILGVEISKDQTYGGCDFARLFDCSADRTIKLLGEIQESTPEIENFMPTTKEMNTSVSRKSKKNKIW